MDKLLANGSVVKSKKLRIVTLGRAADQKNPKVFNKIATALPNDKFVWIDDGNITITGWLDRKLAMNVIKHTDTGKITNQGKTDVLEECNTEIMVKNIS